MPGRGGYSITITAVDAASKQIDAINKRLNAISAPVHRLRRSFSGLADSTGLRTFVDGLKGARDEASKLLGSVTRIAPSMMALTGGAGLAGIAEVSKQWGNFGTNLLLSSRMAGMSVPQLQRLQHATELAGGSADAASASAQSLNQNLTLAQHGMQVSPQFRAAMSRLGINNWQHETTSQVMPEVLKRLAAMHDVVGQRQFGEAIFGGSFDQMQPLLERGVDGLNHWTKAAQQAGVATQQQVQDARRLQEQSRLLGMDIEKVGFTIMGDLTPSITSAVKGMSNWLQANRQWLAADITGTIKTVATDIGSVVSAFGGLQNTSTLFLEWWAAKFAPAFMRPFIRAHVAVNALTDWMKEHHIAGADELNNAATGAEVGGAIGSIVPGVGTAVGAAVGAGVGAAVGAASDIPTKGKAAYGFAHALAVGDMPELTMFGKPAGSHPSATHAEFLRRIAPLARKEAAQTGVDPRIIEAQAALETGWGAHAPNNNFFGIKGPGSGQTTREFVNGRWITTRANFASYPSMGASFDAYGRLIETSPNYARLRHAHGLIEQSDALAASGYATDPYYGAKIYNIASSLPLPPQAAPGHRVPPQAPAAHLAAGASAGGAVTHTVKGAAEVHVHLHGAPPGTSTSAIAHGDLFKGAPKVVTAMPESGLLYPTTPQVPNDIGAIVHGALQGKAEMAHEAAP